MRRQSYSGKVQGKPEGRIWLSPSSLLHVLSPSSLHRRMPLPDAHLSPNMFQVEEESTGGGKLKAGISTLLGGISKMLMVEPDSDDEGEEVLIGRSGPVFDRVKVRRQTLDFSKSYMLLWDDVSNKINIKCLKHSLRRSPNGPQTLNDVNVDDYYTKQF